MVVRHEEGDGRLHPVRPHSARELHAASAAQLNGFEDRGTSVHSEGIPGAARLRQQLPSHERVEAGCKRATPLLPLVAPRTIANSMRDRGARERITMESTRISRKLTAWVCDNGEHR